MFIDILIDLIGLYVVRTGTYKLMKWFVSGSENLHRGIVLLVQWSDPIDGDHISGSRPHGTGSAQYRAFSSKFSKDYEIEYRILHLKIQKTVK